jgi:general secretion pathway protein G
MTRPACPPSRGGFTVAEFLIVLVVLGLLAAVAVPRFTQAADASRAAALRDQLRMVRTQILIYRAEHDGLAPGFPLGHARGEPNCETFLAQLMEADSRSDIGPTRRPVNPISGSSEILIVPAGAPFPLAPTGGQGWVYQPSTGAFAANVAGADADGVDYFDY